MAQPTSGDVHVDAALTNLSVAYMQDAANFISSQAFPVVPVDKRSDKYFTYTKGDWRRNIAKVRAPGSESAGGGFAMSTGTYSADVFSFHKDVDDQVRANADAAVDPDEDASRFVAQTLLIQKEVQWATDYFAISIWGTDVVGTTNFTKWNDGSSDPETDIDTGKNTVLKNTGYMPNKLIVGYEVHQALKKHPLVVERFKYTSSASITPAMLAQLFEVDQYLIAKASYNTAQEGASDSNSFVLGDNALLCYAPPSPSLLTPSAGYTFVWSGLTGLNNQGYRVKNFRLERNAADRIEGEFAYDHKVVATDLGYFFSDCT